MAKQPIRVVPSDDCEVVDGGILTYPHRGASVSLCGWLDLDALCVMYQLGDLLGQVAASEDEEALRLINTSDPLLEKFIGALAPLIVSWTWTDACGEALPQPHLNAAALKALTLDELIYLALLATPKLPEGQKVTHIPRWLRRRMRRKSNWRP